MHHETSGQPTFFISESSKVKMSLKTMIGLGTFLVSLVGMIVKLQLGLSEAERRLEKAEERIERLIDRK